MDRNDKFPITYGQLEKWEITLHRNILSNAGQLRNVLLIISNVY